MRRSFSEVIKKSISTSIGFEKLGFGNSFQRPINAENQYKIKLVILQIHQFQLTDLQAICLSLPFTSVNDSVKEAHKNYFNASKTLNNFLLIPFPL